MLIFIHANVCNVERLCKGSVNLVDNRVNLFVELGNLGLTFFHGFLRRRKFWFELVERLDDDILVSTELGELVLENLLVGLQELHILLNARLF